MHHLLKLMACAAAAEAVAHATLVPVKLGENEDIPVYVGGDADAPAVIVIQEWWGVDRGTMQKALRLAQHGYRVLVPDIYKGKKGITLNLKEPAAIALLKRLAASSDIVLENMSAGALERSGIGYDALRKDNPGLVMVAMSGAGQFGPASDMRTYAPTMSSFVGLESLVGYPDEPPTGALNFAIGDPNAAAHALVAQFAALEHREAGGDGCYIDLSQTEALFSTLMPYVLQAQAMGGQPSPVGNSHPTMVPHGIYRAAGEDSWLSLTVRDDHDWQALGRLATGQDWMQGDRFATTAGRSKERLEVERLLEQWTSAQDAGSLVAQLRDAGIPASPVHDIEGVFGDGQIAGRELADKVELPGLGEEILFRLPWRVSGIRPQAGTRGPVIGEHNEAILQGFLGLTEEEYQRLAEAGAI